MRAESDTYAGARALVLGLGRFGGGLETARFLLDEGAEVLLSDSATREELAEPAAQAEALGATLAFGPQTDALLEGRDVVFASPALPFDHPVLRAAWERGLQVTTEINVVLARAPAPVFGVTGTKGKSTTTTLLAAMLTAAGHTVHAGGNIGRPLIGMLPDIASSHRIVLELSSFQLWWARKVARAPHVTLVTNLMSDHLDRHGTQAHYAESKRAALDFQGPDDIAVLPADDEAVRAAGWFDAGAGRRVTYGEGGDYTLDGDKIAGPGGRASCAAMALQGAHNRRNALSAAAAARQDADVPWSAVEAGACATEPLPHRLQPAGTIGGVRFVDDSNATHPESTCVALTAFDGPVILIAGGKDKGADTEHLHATIAARAKGLVGIGATGPDLVDAVGDDVVHCIAKNMDEAVAKALHLAVPGDVVLLSPGYSSLDWYSSFAERGDRFQAAVARLAAQG